ncbi:helix-turn-helix transcriptional regulator [Microbispora sp. RL4-1S]|uniref:Helix-turn-helix transcriptional regulator n=1 Tax=Microbispora oryzae TaxID=2806554 RepID=A0A940WLS8_9ACTN|nr:helix-turn-helix transcriptional regulator [Microbispora oryzae]MBP2708004.1 helix-turn-helix transcriptional regulator [Microbispora oryzae]
MPAALSVPLHDATGAAAAGAEGVEGVEYVGEALLSAAFLRAAVDLLGSELRRPPRPGADAVLPTLLDLLLLYILRAWFSERRSHDDSHTGWAAALHDPFIAAALRAIHAEAGRQWTVEELYLVGQPPLTYLTWWRLTTAARLLRTCDAPVNTIAHQVGYTSPYAFTHAFKRQYGTPPGAYRHHAATDGVGDGPAIT